MSSRFLPCNNLDASSELLLVEGQSALHAVEQVRQRRSQAVLALQGKLPNVLTRPKHVIKRNVHCQELFNTLGCGSGEECDPDAMSYGAVVILSDPDVDGAHSRYLLLQLFQHFLLPVVQAGKLRLVVSPRYRYDPANTSATDEASTKSSTFFWSQEDKQQFLDNQPTYNKGRITVFKGLGSLSKHELSQCVVAKETRHEVDLYKKVVQNGDKH